MLRSFPTGLSHVSLSLLLCLHLGSSPSLHIPSRSCVAILHCTQLRQFSRASGRIVQVVPTPGPPALSSCVRLCGPALSHKRVASIVSSAPTLLPATLMGSACALRSAACVGGVVISPRAAVHHLLSPVRQRDRLICADLHSRVNLSPAVSATASSTNSSLVPCALRHRISADRPANRVLKRVDHVCFALVSRLAMLAPWAHSRVIIQLPSR